MIIRANDSSSRWEGPPDSDSLSDSEIPPAIACAHCGLSTCDGCAPDPTTLVQASPLAWERGEFGHFQRLWLTSRATAFEGSSLFRDIAREGELDVPPRLGPALAYAWNAEFWAVLSWTMPWALGFYLLFPRLSRHMLTTPLIVGIGFAILLLLVAGVVLIHLWWGLAVEWGVSRTGKSPAWRSGLRFGLYACGWDLLTSPVSVLAHLVRLGPSGALASVKAGARVPRVAVQAYLSDGRGLPERTRKRALWIAVWITSAGLLLGALALLAGIIVWMLRDL